MELNDIHEAFQSKLRLMILSALISGGKSFKELKSITEATDGNLSVQITKLEEWGFVTTTKSFILKKPQTVINITEKGTIQFKEYVLLLNKVLADT